MKPLYHPRLINGILGDPALYIEFTYTRRALLFDCGQILHLSSRRLLKISDVFISHTHMDHFIGFDHLLRLLLGREKVLTVYGPQGLIDRLHHRLQSYTWNLVHNYANHFEIRVLETDGRTIRKARFICRQGFAKQLGREMPFQGVLLSEPAFSVQAAVLDHGIPSLAFALTERVHLNVNRSRLEERGLVPGPWLAEVKEHIWRETPKDRIITAETLQGDTCQLTLGKIEEEFIIRSPGQRIAYVADAAYTPENREKIVALAREADYFFCEAAFLDEHAKQAQKTRHLTARQAGELAAAAGVRRLIPFHFSARYEDRAEELLKEAEAAFTAARTKPVPKHSPEPLPI